MKPVFILPLVALFFVSCGSNNPPQIDIESGTNLVTKAAACVKKMQLNEATTLLEDAMKSGFYNAMDVVSDEQFSPLIEDPIQRPIIKSLVEKYASTSKARMYTKTEEGVPILIQGTIRNKADSTPLSNALLELVQADHHGSYFNEEDKWNPRLFAFLVSDENGQFEVETIQPGRYTHEGEELASHIHFNLTKPNFTILSGEFSFNNDPIIIDQGNLKNIPLTEYDETTGIHHLTLYLEKSDL